MRGGTVMPSEYFGVNSGRYMPVPPTNQAGPYGDYIAQSFGQQGPHQNAVGPNLFVSPNSSNQQTGGARRRRRVRRNTRRTVRTRRTKRSCNPGTKKKRSRSRRSRR
jgi:hypothetical protein